MLSINNMSYYVTIDGVKMDKSLIELAEKWDGYPDYVAIPLFLHAIQDGGKITRTEKNTMDYILKKYYSKSALFMSVCGIVEYAVRD